MAPYLTNTLIATRLTSRFAVTATITVGDADIASDDLDSSGPFIGERQADGQERAFPRSISPDGTDNTNPAIPDAILDWVALRAYQLSTDEDPPVQSEAVIDRSLTFTSPKISQTEKRKERLLDPYLANAGGFSTIGVTSTFDPSPPFDEFEVPVEWPMTEFP